MRKHERAGRAGGATVAVSSGCALALLLFALLFAPSGSEAAAYQENAWRYQPVSSLILDVGFGYERLSGDYGEGRQFTQEYDLSIGGNIFDPRLASYRFSAGFYDESNTDYYSPDYDEKMFGMEFSFFNRINRDRGLKLWKYLPSPLTVSYFHYDNTDAKIDTIGIGMYYTRPGYIRFFGPNGFMAYQLKKDSDVSNAQNTNRYRLKYDSSANWNRNGSGNYNRNGNGNWNRNGNGNWNRNGNGNWNRNGNGNWNRNGNGNWNRNGNGNWNRNGNGNWNRNGNGNWNRNGGGNPGTGNFGNGNWGQIQEKAKRPMLLKFPEMSIDYTWYKIFDKDTSEVDKSSTGNIRITSHNAERDPKTNLYYSSVYGLYYRTYNLNNDESDIESIKLQARNKWTRFITETILEDKTVDDYGTFSATHYSYFNDTAYENLKYMVGVQGTYEKTDDLTTYTYGAVLDASQMLSKEARLTPKLVSNTSLAVSYERDDDTVVDGVKTSGENRYSVYVTEVLTSYYAKHSVLEGKAKVGYTESGVPVHIRILDRSKGYKKLSYQASYEYDTFYERAYSDRSTDQSINIDINYYVFSNLRFKNVWDLMDHQEDQSSDHERTSKMLAQLDWNVTSATNTLARYKITDTEDQRDYEMYGKINSKLDTRTEVSVSAARDWDDANDGYDDTLNGELSWKFRQMLFGASYEKKTYRDDSTENTIYLSLKRRFSANIGRMF